MSIESFFRSIVGATAEQISLFTGSYVPGDALAHEIMPEQHQGVDRRRALVLTAVLFAAPGCIAAVRSPIPKEPYIGELPTGYTRVAKNIPHLIEETRQLPMIRDGLSAGDAEILNDLVGLIAEDSQNFSEAFREMYHVGIPGKRDHNTPLETLCFMLEDGKDKDARKVLENYSLDKLLARGWFKERDLLSQNDAERIVGHIADPKKRESYMQLFQRVDNAQFIGYVKEDAKRGLFDDGVKAVIDEIGSRKQTYRWNDFDIVVNRLNAPELVHHWLRRNFKYEYYVGDRRTNRAFFSDKKGNCVDYSQFAAMCLRNAGYRSGTLRVYEPPDNHRVTYVWKNDKLLILDRNYDQIRGPFKNYQSAPYKILDYLQ